MRFLCCRHLFHRNEPVRSIGRPSVSSRHIDTKLLVTPSSFFQPKNDVFAQLKQFCVLCLFMTQSDPINDLQHRPTDCRSSIGRLFHDLRACVFQQSTNDFHLFVLFVGLIPSEVVLLSQLTQQTSTRMGPLEGSSCGGWIFFVLFSPAK